MVELVELLLIVRRYLAAYFGCCEAAFDLFQQLRLLLDRCHRHGETFDFTYV
jgi:hypothetical protein